VQSVQRRILSDTLTNDCETSCAWSSLAGLLSSGVDDRSCSATSWRKRHARYCCTLRTTLAVSRVREVYADSLEEQGERMRAELARLVVARQRGTAQTSKLRDELPGFRTNWQWSTCLFRDSFSNQRDC
jgi:hypothetical protein